MPLVFVGAPVFSEELGAETDCRRFLEKQNPDPLVQWLTWEVTANLPQYREVPGPVPISMLRKPLDDVIVREARDPSALPDSIRKFFLHGGEVIWLRHPYNTSEWVPYFLDPAAGTVPGHLTASRSVGFLAENGDAFSVKLPTNRPHQDEWQDKADLRKSVKVSLRRSDLIHAVDKVIGVDPNLIILRDVLSVADRRTGNGFVVRDLRPLQDGHYWLPAFSIPYEGFKIGGKEFWAENYAALLGRSKAKLLLRYGLEMRTPNPQNMLVRLDGNVGPPGVLAWRDMSDSALVEPIADALGFGAAIQADRADGISLVERLNPNFQNLGFARMELGTDTVREWSRVHTKAYVDEITRMLGLQDGEFMRGDYFSPGKIQDTWHRFALLGEFLFSPEGLAALRQYARRRGPVPDLD